MKHRLMKHDLKVVENVIAKSLLVSLSICYVNFLLDQLLAGDYINMFGCVAYYVTFICNFFPTCFINNVNILPFRLNPMKAAMVLGQKIKIKFQ